MADPFERKHAPPYGAPEALAPGIVAVTAPNPGPMTFTGTRTYLVGAGRDRAVIDPGPDDPRHLDAVAEALGPGVRAAAILVTHAHLDHSAGARRLAARLDAPILAFGERPRSPAMARLAAAGALGGGEGIDAAFLPDLTLADGALVEGAGWTLRAIHTPGHIGNHLCLAWGDRVFSGDHVMGWATSLVSPPDGDMGAYMQSLDRLAAERAARLYPGHGDPVADPAARIAALAAHRREREAQILSALAAGPADAPALAARIYQDTPSALLPAATRNVLAHLVDLMDRNLVLSDSPPGPASRFRAI